MTQIVIEWWYIIYPLAKQTWKMTQNKQIPVKEVVQFPKSNQPRCSNPINQDVRLIPIPNQAFVVTNAPKAISIGLRTWLVSEVFSLTSNIYLLGRWLRPKSFQVFENLKLGVFRIWVSWICFYKKCLEQVPNICSQMLCLNGDFQGYTVRTKQKHHLQQIQGMLLVMIHSFGLPPSKDARHN